MSPSTAGRYLSLTWEMTKISILSAMEYRVSFLMQVVGMAVNDVALIGLWYIFFQRFPVVNGWTFSDSAALFAVTTVNFGLVMVFARGAREIARTIANGELDYYLAFPKNVLWHVCFGKTDLSAIGDFFFGLAIFFLSGHISVTKFALFMGIALLTALIFLNFMIITQSIAFFVGNFEDAAEQWFHALLGFTLYPQAAFGGVLKMVMLTVVPAFFISTIPARLVQHFSLTDVAWLMLYWIASSLLAVFIFYRGLRRYESGNLIGAKI